MTDGWDKVIIGIDPGTNVMGYGILGVRARKPQMIALGVIQLSRLENHYMRLHRIYERVLGLVEQYLPDEMAIEAIFRQKRPVHAQARQGPGRGHGRGSGAAGAHHRI